MMKQTRMAGGRYLENMKRKVGRIKKSATSTKKTVKRSAKAAKKNVKAATRKQNPLEAELHKAIKQYNSAHTAFNEHGMELFIQRQRSVDLLEHIEALVNSISKTPKKFKTEISEIDVEKKRFRGACDYAKAKLNSARKAAAGTGAGLAGGAAVAAMAPSVAMWIATTFGTASTGTAISALSGAAATNAALAWIGGGTLAMGSGGVAAGEAFLLMSGPIGWSVAGATLVSSVILFSAKKKKINEELKKEIESVQNNTTKLRKTDADLISLTKKTDELRKSLSDQFHGVMKFYSCKFGELSDEEQLKLGTIVNNAKTLALLIGENLESN